MFKLDYLLLCEDVIIDQMGRVSAIKIFDELIVSAFPASHNGFKILFRLNPKEEKDLKNLSLNLLFKVSDPSNKEIARAEANPKDFTIKKGGGLVSAVDFSPVVFAQEGLHKIEFSINKKLEGVKNFEVRKQ